MGMYDTVNVPCPKCDKIYLAQSKSGPCELEEYDLATCPPDVLDDVNRHAPFKCDECQTVFEVGFTERTIIIPFVRRTDMRPKKNYLWSKEMDKLLDERGD